MAEGSLTNSTETQEESQLLDLLIPTITKFTTMNPISLGKFWILYRTCRCFRLMSDY